MRASKLSDIDRAALRLAAACGWLTLTPGLADVTLAVWQRQCARVRWPFAVVRPEPKRATMWLTLPPGHEWSSHKQQLARDVLTHAAGIVLYPAGARAFLASSTQETVMRRLLALALAGEVKDQTAQA
jgi:hypothetical protein